MCSSDLVSAKDLGTGKEQKIRIESSSGLSDAEIEKMVKEAELHAEEDKRERSRIDARNEADSLIYSTEKSLTEYGDKISGDDKASIESAIADLKATLENQGADADAIKAKSEALQQAAYKLAEEVYKASAAEGGGEQAGPADAQQGPSQASHDDGVEDADFEVVD